MLTKSTNFQLASFIADGSEDVRYYGRLIVYKLMNHEDFNKCLDKYLSPDNAKAVKNIANTIKQRVIDFYFLTSLYFLCE